MTTLRTVVALAVLFCLSACGQIQQQKINQQAALINSQNKAQIDAIAARCNSKLVNSEFDLIRDKVELNRTVPDAPAPFSMTANTNYPTDQEKQIIAKWAEIRIECQKEAGSFFQSASLPPNVNRVQAEKARSFITMAGQKTNDLTVALHAGKITYGEFARKRVETGTEAKNLQREYIEALQIADYQRRMHEAQLAEQRQQSSMAAWAVYLQGLQALQPQPPRTLNLQTNCTTQRFGNTSTTNCF